MDIYDSAHMDYMFYFCNDNADEYVEFCASHSLEYDNLLVAFCQRHESEYIDFLEHYGYR